ncbi:MAG: paraquat-inducible protein A [Sphingobacteriia bacterium]|nr:paraquat-inducible protein A [Sphingobacteriia bacterium]NCC40727.1 paraquat-inducible protein A [Gammaproteobacteria bacterium]
MSGARRLRSLLAILIMLVVAWLMVALIGDLNRVKGLKTDLAELHHARHGLLNAGVWRAQVGAILDRRVDGLILTETSRERVTAAVTELLNGLIRELERNLSQPSPRAGGGWLDQLQGALQQGLQDLLLDVTRLRDRVPEYADTLVEQLAMPGVKERIKVQLRAWLDQAVVADHTDIERARLETVLARHACDEVAACSARLASAITSAQPAIQQRLLTVIALVALLFPVALAGADARPRGSARAPAPHRPAPEPLSPLSLSLLVGGVLLLLAGGLSTPMIAVDARISELSLHILGEPVVFTDQVLYFQTKSIIEVMRLLLESGEPDMLLVAVLLTLFSLIFPLLKVIATFIHHADLGGLRASAVVGFFALRSGKWSMADVMVVAIFMAYIGFDALVANQLASLRGASEGVVVLTTNATSLEPGFFLFLAFVLAGLVLSSVLESSAQSARVSSTPD